MTPPGIHKQLVSYRNRARDGDPVVVFSMGFPTVLWRTKLQHQEVGVNSSSNKFRWRSHLYSSGTVRTFIGHWINFDRNQPMEIETISFQKNIDSSNQIYRNNLYEK
jgi:hypothetical protein